MRTSNRHPITDSIIHSLKGDVTTNKTGGTHLNNHNKPNSANHTYIASPKTHKIQDTNHLMLDKPIHHQMLRKFTNQPTVNQQSQPSTSSPLPSQPLPNPKGGMNMVHNEVAQEEEEEDEEEEGEDEWLYELLVELASSDESNDEEEVEEEEEEKIIEKQDEEETFFIATIFGGGKKVEHEIPIKFEDPGPCLVTCKIRGVDIRECLCDHGACESVMPFELYETLELGSLKKSKEVFTMVDASLVSVARIAENVLIKTFHVTPPPTPRKKGVHHFQICEEGTRKISVVMEAREKEKEFRKKEGKLEKGSRITPSSEEEEKERRFEANKEKEET
ncbi:hypothetical protein PIB30_061825 [Stylosanthes scabra]|uniref:Uncharacterized protein n=1 Tax=Stylosanthes scabra TaxID=79078 RepID=A0ABU6ZJM7_9FABA|nr:hypothetical protein [Stylosanthes scabra]